MDLDTTSSHSIVNPIRYLTKEQWVFVIAAEASQDDNDELAYYDFCSNITTCVKLHDNTDIWMVHLTSLVGPYFVLYNKNYRDSDITDNVDIDGRTGYIFNLMSK